MPFWSEPKYLRVTLDRSLTYRGHLESLREKMTSRVALLRELAESGWGAGATWMRITTLALVYSTAEYCAPVCCRSAHSWLIAINDALRIVAGYLRPTPADNLPFLADIQPAELRRNGDTLSLARRAMEPGHLLHSALTRPPSANARHLDTHSCPPPPVHLTTTTYVQRTGDHLWKVVWLGNLTRLRTFFTDIGTHPHGMTLPRTAWVWLNRIRTRCWTFPLLLVQMGYALLCGLWVWHRTRPCCPSVSNPPASSRTARPDGSGQWDNRMAAQHLPRDLVRPSSVLKNWLKRQIRR